MMIQAAVRRAIIADVPTIAVDYVTFVQNTSDVPDEVIAHRAGMISLKQHASIPSSFHIKHEGPCTIELPFSVYEGIPLVVLSQGQELNMICNTARGCGRQHAKWCPVSAVTHDLKTITPCNDMSDKEILSTARHMLVDQLQAWKQGLIHLRYGKLVGKGRGGGR